MKIVKIAAFVTVMLLPLASEAFAGKALEKFAPAYLNGKQIDWCLKFGSLCGKPAADAFCHKKGYETAVAYAKDNSPALPTLVIGDGSQCNAEGQCKGLISVTCGTQTQAGNLENDVGMIGEGDEAPPPSTDQPLKPGDKLEGDQVIHYFNKPKWQGAAVDWCKVWGNQCGKPAADAFCQTKSYANATQQMKGSLPQVTRIITSGQVCSDNTCRALAYVKCVRSKNG